MSRTEVSSSNILLNDKCLPIVASQDERTKHLLYFHDDVRYADPKTQIGRRTKDEEVERRKQAEREEEERLRK